MWVPARSTGARRGFCLGYTACLAPLASACLPRRVTPRGASLFFFLSRARVLDRRLLPSEAAEPSLSLSHFPLRRRLRRRRCALAPRLAAGHSGSSLLHAAEIQPAVVLQESKSLKILLEVESLHNSTTVPVEMEFSKTPLNGGGGSTNQQVMITTANVASMPSAEEMPCTNTPAAFSELEVLVQGVEQTIYIPLKTILVKVMESLPAKEAPVFECVRDGCSYQANVLLNVSGVRFTSEPVVSVAKVLGDVCSGEDEALLSAVENAFEYLEKNHLIHVADWSSKVAQNYEDKHVFSDLNESSYAIEKVIAEWSQVIDKVGSFRSELETKEILETVHDMRSAVGEVFCEGKELVGSVIKTFVESHRAMYLAWRECESQRSMHLKVCNDKGTGYLMKGLSEVVHFTAKDVLDYVLEFIGLPKADYSNEVLFKCGLFRGEVIIQLPKVEAARCGGRTKFHGIDLFTAAEAEEDAAGKALRFLETRLKLVIVDKNYADRVEAKTNHVFRTRLLENFLGVAERIKKQWAHMNEYLNGAVHVFAGEGVLISADQVAARKIVFDGFVKVGDDCNSRYEAACSKIKDMYKYYPKVAKLNN